MILWNLTLVYWLYGVASGFGRCAWVCLICYEVALFGELIVRLIVV